VKSYGDILATLDSANKNRGLFFDAELVPFCSREFRVKARLTNFIDEKTRKDGVAQDARRHSRERLVPIALQYLPGFLPKKHLFMVARSLAGQNYRKQPGGAIAIHEESRLRVFKRPESFAS